MYTEKRTKNVYYVDGFLTIFSGELLLILLQLKHWEQSIHLGLVARRSNQKRFNNIKSA